MRGAKSTLKVDAVFFFGLRTTFWEARRPKKNIFRRAGGNLGDFDVETSEFAGVFQILRPNVLFFSTKNVEEIRKIEKSA